MVETYFQININEPVMKQFQLVTFCILCFGAFSYAQKLDLGSCLNEEDESGKKRNTYCVVEDLINSSEDFIIDFSDEDLNVFFDAAGKSSITVVVVEKTKAISRTKVEVNFGDHMVKINWLKDTLKTLVENNVMTSGEGFGHQINVSFANKQLPNGSRVAPVIAKPIRYKGYNSFKEYLKFFNEGDYQKALDLEKSISLNVDVIQQISLICDYKLGNTKRLFLDYKPGEIQNIPMSSIDDFDMKILRETDQLTTSLYDSLNLFYTNLVVEKTQSLLDKGKYSDAKRMSLKVLNAKDLFLFDELLNAYTTCVLLYGQAIEELHSKKEIKGDDEFKSYLDKSDQENAEIKKLLKKYFS